MKTTNNRRRFLRQGNGRRHSDRHANRDYPGEFAHRYSENIEGDQYLPGNWERDEGGEEEWENWDENPGENIDYNRFYGHTQGGEWMQPEPQENKQQRGSEHQREFRAHNTRFRNRLRGYRYHLKDTSIDYDRDDLSREKGSIDEHMGRRRNSRYDNW